MCLFYYPLFNWASLKVRYSEAFAATGWRVGWLIGPKSLIVPTLAATTRIVFCSNSPLQEAVAGGLEQVVERRFFETQVAEYQERRDILTAAFDKLGLKYTLPQGSYFILLVRALYWIYRIFFQPSFWQDISAIHWPDNYPFPKSLDGRGRDFR